MVFSEELMEKAQRLVEHFTQYSYTLTTAESCTGGLLGGLITSVSGASSMFHQGFITYSNDAKEMLLGVPKGLLTAHGAVSAQAAQAMAEGALRKSFATHAISITGIAGPGGGTSEKPVGLVYVGLARKERQSTATRFLFSGTRQKIRLQALNSALEILMQNH